MKTFRKFLIPIIVLAAFAVFFLVAWLIPSDGSSAPADFDIESYEATYTVHEDLRVEAVEHVSVRFFSPRHGLIRDLPLEQGVRYENITATRDGRSVPTSFRNDSISFISLAVGDEDGELLTAATYDFSYTMYLPPRGDNLSLDVFGYGWNAKVEDMHVLVTVPEGHQSFKIFSGKSGTQSDDYNVLRSWEGNTLTLTASRTGRGGVTVDIGFEEGVLKAQPDLGPLWAALILIGLVAVFAVVKFAFCRAPLITRTVNLSAPDGMDPLLMGTLIDDKADTEDLGALVFWLAAQGYLTIDLKDKDDPILIKTEKEPDPAMPPHARILWHGLFHGRDSVKTSDLSEHFYHTAEEVKNSAKASAGKVYAPVGRTATVVLGVLAVLLCGGFAFLLNDLKVGSGYQYFTMFLVCAAAYAVSALFSFTAERLRNKWKKAKWIALRCGAFLLGCLPCLVAVFAQSGALTLWGRMLLTVACALLGTLSGTLSVYTKEHAEKLGQILGFRDFILYTERDKIQFMLQENPDLYYRILPYAQVLGVTDAWTDKFAGLDLMPPAYLSAGPSDLLNALILRDLFLSINVRMTTNMLSRPVEVNRGGGGGFGGFGGGGGGFGGGGFGGGGGRSF